MIVTAILLGCVLWCMLIGHLPTILLVGVSIMAAALWMICGHTHDSPIHIDVLARQSRLRNIDPALKTVISMILLCLCIVARKPWAPCICGLIVSCMTIRCGGIKLSKYLRLFSVPMTFLLLSSIALLWSWTDQPQGIMTVWLGWGWLSLLAEAQQTAQLITCRALGAVSCLYFLSLSTPISDLIVVARRARIPWVINDLAILIYRYLFILFDTAYQMRYAAESRMGFHNLSAGLVTTGKLYGLLLVNSFRKAGQCFDAMESRCYQQDIHFLVEQQPVQKRTWFGFAVLCLFIGVLTGITFI